ncbi:MAG: HypC/HybG/HupF family hydrogenase formation chaperone [Armatimonadetes bacterium]|nr:HypC/HybG/HupF family hydrogenase formation chaperone [Candidatus Hippobium faecium]
MCVAHPAKVLEIKEDKLVCDFLGVREVCAGDLCPNAKIGDFVLIHGGYAMQILDEEEACLSLDVFRELGEITEEMKNR